MTRLTLVEGHWTIFSQSVDFYPSSVRKKVSALPKCTCTAPSLQGGEQQCHCSCLPRDWLKKCKTKHLQAPNNSKNPYSWTCDLCTSKMYSTFRTTTRVPLLWQLSSKCLSNRSVWSTKAHMTLHGCFLNHVPGLTKGQCLVLPLLCRLGSLLNTFWKEVWKWNCRREIPLLSRTQASFEKVAEEETTVEALFHFLQHQELPWIR